MVGALVRECRYLRLSCSDEEHPLFRRDYARSNRERGVKLLRCFPHCCPDHASRSYCGGSIHLLVTFDTDVSVVGIEDLVVCARFEPSEVVPRWPAGFDPGLEDTVDRSDECYFEPGESVVLPSSVMHLTAVKPTKESVWVRAEKETEVKQRPLPKDTVLYVINNQRFPKWYYSYDTSVTRAQRDMTHHLAAYVFRLTGGRAPLDQQQTATVLARHASPPFTLVSYRRVGGSRPAGCTLPAIGDSAGSTRAMGAASDIDTDNNIPMPAASIQHDHFTQSRLSLASILVPSTGIADSDEEESKIESDVMFWQMDLSVRQTGAAEKLQHLIILWRFMGVVTLADADFCLNALDSHIREHWLAAAAALSAPSGHLTKQLEDLTASFSLGLFQCHQSSQPASTPPDASSISCRDQTLLRACAHLLMRAFSSRRIQQLIQSAFTDGSQVSGEPQLRETFVRLVSDMYDALGELLVCIPSDLSMERDSALSTSCGSIPALVDDVLSLVYGRHLHFGSLRPEVSALLMAQQTPSALSLALSDVFGAFMTQVREQTIATAKQQHGPVQWPEAWTQEDTISSSQNPWNQRWLLEPDSIRVFPTADDPQHPSCEPSLLQLIHWLHEFGCVDLLVQDDATCCSVRSVLTTSDEITPMKLVLDGRLRVCRVLPSGLLSMAVSSGFWVFGDYAAIFSDGDMRVLEVRFYLLAESRPRKVSARDHARGELGVDNVSVASNGVTRVRRIHLTLTLEEDVEPSLDGAVPPTPDDNAFIFIHGVVHDAVYEPPGAETSDALKFSKLPSDERAAILTELAWMEVLALQTGYAVARNVTA